MPSLRSMKPSGKRRASWLRSCMSPPGSWRRSLMAVTRPAPRESGPERQPRPGPGCARPGRGRGWRSGPDSRGAGLVTAINDLRQLPGGLMHDLSQLARRFPEGFIERKDGIDYVAHHVVTQRLLSIVGPFDFELVEIIRGDVAAATPDPNGRSRRAMAGTPALRNVVVGGVWRLTCEVDGHRVRIEEVGDVGDVHNWPHDGARLKDAASDALKRCAMRLGLGLHLWAQEHYFLDRQLWASLEQPDNAAEAEEAAARQPGPAGDGPAGPKPTAEPDAGDDPEAAASAPGAKRMPVSGTAEW